MVFALANRVLKLILSPGHITTIHL